MTLNRAFEIVNSASRTGTPKLHYLACGFEPLHLKTMLHAELLERLPADNVVVGAGVYGDLRGNIEDAARSGAVAAAVVLEWSDVDPRLGLRSAGGWGRESKADIVNCAGQSFARIASVIEQCAARMAVVLMAPTLPLPPIGNTIRAQKSVLELDLERELALFIAQAARMPGVRVANLQTSSPAPLDAGMELKAGFPYTLPFAGELAGALVRALYPPAPKKGLITDLDETLWSGIVGEIGVEGVSWQQADHTQVHGLYQQMLGHLASCGVLLGVCSKNEASVVEAALSRKDLFFDSSALFPVYANWGAKSASVAATLRAWNIAEDAVVFVDDNPVELAEVQQMFPAMTCRLFQAKYPSRVWDLLGELRDLFGKSVLMEEDLLRAGSLRASAQLQELGDATATPEFLRGLDGVITLSWAKDANDKRPLELINKTNQFNLNGARIGEGEWQQMLEDANTILGVVSYQDKFGPLGKIAVVAGRRAGAKISISHWVLSCRAFSRRLEHHTLDCLFRRFAADEIDLAFQPTERNQPLQDFLSGLGATQSISREDFSLRCGELPHRVSETES